MTNNQKIVIRFKKPVFEQSIEGAVVSRILGFISAIDLVKIAREVGLKANPRDAKENRITEDIIDSIKTDSLLYPFKTKGVLVAVSRCEALDRGRFELSFDNSDIEGILDGGHNVFAIIKYLLTELSEETKIKAKIWLELKPIFERNYDQMLLKLQEDQKSEDPRYNFCIPLELIKPSSKENINAFKDVLIEICGARNNNVQLKDETKDNKEGLYDFLKDEVLPKKISESIIWRSNGEGHISSSEIIALSWIALKSIVPDFPLNKIYSSKGDCIQKYSDLLKEKDNSGNFLYVRKDDDSKIVITSDLLKSALRLVAQIPSLYDFIYKEFPNSYNRSGGAFGKIKCVKMLNKDQKREFLTKYCNFPCDYSYPEGFIIPIVCGASALVEKDKNGLFMWKEDPQAFFSKNLDRILKVYKGYMDMANCDPQIIGKNISCYTTIEEIVGFLVD